MTNYNKQGIIPQRNSITNIELFDTLAQIFEEFGTVSKNFSKTYRNSLGERALELLSDMLTSLHYSYKAKNPEEKFKFISEIEEKSSLFGTYLEMLKTPGLKLLSEGYYCKLAGRLGYLQYQIERWRNNIKQHRN